MSVQHAQTFEVTENAQISERALVIRTDSNGDWTQDAIGVDHKYTKFDVVGDGNCFFYAYAASRAGKVVASSAVVTRARADLCAEVLERYSHMTGNAKRDFDMRVKFSYSSGENGAPHWRVYTQRDWRTVQKAIREIKPFVTSWAGDEYLKMGTPVEDGITFSRYLGCGADPADAYFAVRLVFDNTGLVCQADGGRPSYVCELCLPYVPTALGNKLWVRSISPGGVSHILYRPYVGTDTMLATPVYLVLKDGHYDALVSKKEVNTKKRLLTGRKKGSGKPMISTPEAQDRPAKQEADGWEPPEVALGKYVLPHNLSSSLPPHSTLPHTLRASQ